jgi:hypothetical protein
MWLRMPPLLRETRPLWSLHTSVSLRTRSSLIGERMCTVLGIERNYKKHKYPKMVKISIYFFLIYKKPSTKNIIVK